MITIGLLGNGVVGSGVVELVNKNKEDNIKISKILVRDVKKHENDLNYSLLTDQIEDIFKEDVDIIVEVMGGIQPAYDYIKKSLKNKKHVVTANKDLISKYGQELLKIARENNVKLYFEASVGGGIPILRPLNECLIGNKIKSIKAILNGTTNFILTKMDKEKVSYENALKVAQDLGFAETDPTSDVKGYDSARKLAILSTLAYGKKIDWEKFQVEGMDEIDEIDIKKANKIGGVVKLLGMSEIDEDKVYAKVRPAIVMKNSILGKVENEFNAILVEGDSVGELVFYGKGAGKLPTASAIYADIADIIRNKKEKPILFNETDALLENNLNKKTNWYVRIQCEDRHAVINKIAEGFKDVSIETDKCLCKNEVFSIIEGEYENSIKKKIEALMKIEGVNKVKFFMII